MKDSYTLDRDLAGLDEGYALHELAYGRIFDRCGLTLLEGRVRHGLHGRVRRARVHGAVVRRRGRGRVVRSRRLRRERRDGAQPHPAAGVPAGGAARRVETPGVATIDALATFLGIDPRATAKAMPVVTDDGTLVLALVRGDRRLHELKLRKALGQAHRPATPEEIEEAFGAKPGSIGPTRSDGGKCRRSSPTRRSPTARMWAARTAPATTLPGSCSAATTRRSSPTCTSSRRAMAARTATARCGSSRRSRSATSSSSARSTPRRSAPCILDESGQERPIVMGSYGIGPARIVAAALEQSYDDAGLHLAGAARAVRRLARADRRRGRGGRAAPRGSARRARAAVMIDDRAQGPGSKLRGCRPDRRAAAGHARQAHHLGRDGRRAPRRDGAEETLPLAQAAARLAELSKELRPK